ncbi:hypothetical protein NIES4101_49210 [Calothrix sp. NIES-4101]|nr:hypothetical protein NIES4101_49210 [Calothrix sp. NIES-4101]
MDDKQRRDRIVNYLRIKPVNHGQIYAFQIAIPASENKDIPFERREYLKMSLSQQGTNLIPLIVRRTEAYSEEEEYELVYGADWCLVAKELDIEKLWVWVFDMSDEEAATAKEEMQQLLEIEKSEVSKVLVETNTKESELIQTIVQQMNKLFQQVEVLSKKIDLVSTSVKELQTIENKPILSDAVISQIMTNIKEVIEEAITKIPTSISGNQQTDYNKMTVPELKLIAKARKIKGHSGMTKAPLIAALTKSDQDD